MNTGYDPQGHARQRGPPQNTPLFEDTSGAHQTDFGGMPMQPGGQNFPGAQFMSDPMASALSQYGQSIAGQGTEMIGKNVEKFVSSSKLKYYFAVDTVYVAKKLSLITFPFMHKDWDVKFQQDTPVPPRCDVNAPDLYIPVMAFVTYILLSGIALGTTEKFSPEELGILASSTIVWLVIEVALISFSLYLVNVRTDLSTWDVLAYSGYKYTGMIAILAAGLLFHSSGYWIALGYMSCSITFFMLRTLRLKILPHTGTDGYTYGGKRRLYLTVIIAAVQPLFMYLLTRHLL